jgi:hypothetical protein
MPRPKTKIQLFAAPLVLGSHAWFRRFAICRSPTRTSPAFCGLCRAFQMRVSSAARRIILPPRYTAKPRTNERHRVSAGAASRASMWFRRLRVEVVKSGLNNDSIAIQAHFSAELSSVPAHSIARATVATASKYRSATG